LKYSQKKILSKSNDLLLLLIQVKKKRSGLFSNVWEKIIFFSAYTGGGKAKWYFEKYMN
jgi:hypothetical protein